MGLEKFKETQPSFERISIHPKEGQNPRELFEALSSMALDGLVLSGSEKSVTQVQKDPWVKDYIDGLSSFLSDWKKLSKPFPVLGICFAHQAISHALGGEVKPSGALKIGPVDVQAIENSLLPKNFTPSALKNWNNFVAFHEDQVMTPPSNMLPIMKSAYCPYQSFVHPTLPLWTVQFHPEMNESILEVSSDKSLWSHCSSKDFKNQKGNDLLEFFAKWILENKT